ncbi:hypothetical protein B4135_0666 [Caldibacillus debilis]|uniref:Uncharacterized protein n=2 Tax=Caldibacillus debilis TaxID=301148 RepID=A0A150LL86_9BACI|nr:hypothetical protein B4135_0666 [Caldibacillus debilis]
MGDPILTTTILDRLLHDSIIMKRSSNKKNWRNDKVLLGNFKTAILGKNQTALTALQSAIDEYRQ